MSFLTIDKRLNTSHHGPPHSVKDAGVAAGSLTGIHNAMKWLFAIKDAG
jgi:hypothetical protein